MEQPLLPNSRRIRWFAPHWILYVVAAFMCLIGIHARLHSNFNSLEQPISEPADEDFKDFPEPRVGASMADPESASSTEADEGWTDGGYRAGEIGAPVIDPNRPPDWNQRPRPNDHFMPGRPPIRSKQRLPEEGVKSGAQRMSESEEGMNSHSHGSSDGASSKLDSSGRKEEERGAASVDNSSDASSDHSSVTTVDESSGDSSDGLDFSKIPHLSDDSSDPSSSDGRPEEDLAHSGKHDKKEKDLSLFGGGGSGGGLMGGMMGGNNMNNGWGAVSNFRTPYMDKVYPGRKRRTERANREDKRVLDEARQRNLRGLKADREESMKIYKDKIDGLKAQNEEDCARAYRSLDSDRETEMRAGALTVDKYKMDWSMHHPGSKLPGSGFFSRMTSSSRSGSGSRRSSWLGRRELFLGGRPSASSSGGYGNSGYGGRNGGHGSRSISPGGWGGHESHFSQNGYNSHTGMGNEPRPLNMYGMEMPTKREMEQRRVSVLMRYGCKEGWNPEKGFFQGGQQMGGPHMAGPPAGRMMGGMQGGGRYASGGRSGSGGGYGANGSGGYGANGGGYGNAGYGSGGYASNGNYGSPGGGFFGEQESVGKEGKEDGKEGKEHGKDANDHGAEANKEHRNEVQDHAKEAVKDHGEEETGIAGERSEEH